MTKFKLWVEKNRPKKLNTTVIAALLLIAVSLGSNQSTGGIRDSEATLQEDISLNIQENGETLFKTILKRGTKVKVLGKSKGEEVLISLKGEVFTVPVYIITPTKESKEVTPIENAPQIEPTVWKVDGKKLTNPIIIKEYPLSVFVEHDGGRTFINKKDIPLETETLGGNSPREFSADGLLEIKSSPSNKTSLFRIKKYMEEYHNGSIHSDKNWSIEREIQRKTQENKDLHKIVGFRYLGLMDCIHEIPTENLLSEVENISLESKFRELGILGKQQESKQCGVAVLATALEYLLRQNDTAIRIKWSDIANHIKRYPDAMGKVGLALGMGPEIMVKGGIPTNKGNKGVDLTIRGIHKFYIMNRDEFLDEEPLTSQSSLARIRIAKVIENELKNNRPVLAGIYTGSSHNKTDTIGPDFLKNNYPHAVLIVGIEKTGDPVNPIRYRILNSWGSSWGDQGYGWLYPNLIEKLYSIAI
jgi:hypothetical protein